MTRWNGDSILAMCQFIDTRVLLTAAELDLFTLLSQKSMTLEEVVSAKKLQERPTRILLDALVGLHFLTKSGVKYSCTTEATRCLTTGSRDSVLPMVRHYAHVWRNVSKLTSIVSSSQSLEDPILSEEERIKAFIGGMHVRARDNAARIVASLDLGDAKKLIDIGGASGSYTLAFLRACNQLKVTLFDLPFVVDLARERIGEAGFLDRVTLVGGDFYVDPLPRGFDVAFISAVIHQNSPEQNIALFKKTLQSLQPGGIVVIRDYVMSPDHTSPASGALFSVNMLASTEGGASYSFEEIRHALEKAGFGRVRLHSGQAEMDCIVLAHKPKSDPK